MSIRSLLSSLAPQRDASRDCGCPDTPAADPAVSAALTALGAKLARADGHAAAVEYDRFVEAFPHEPQADGDVRRLFRLAGETTLGFEGYARRIRKRYGHCPEILERVMSGLFHVAKADGVVTGDELDYLERVSELIGLSPLAYRRLRGEQVGVPANDPYRVLAVAPDASDEAVREAWKRGLRQHHPDRVQGAGAPVEAIDAAAARAGALNAAFDAVMRERRAYAAA